MLRSMLVAIAIACAAPVSFGAHSDQVIVCQVGYLSNESKFAMVTAEAKGDAVIHNAKDQSTVLTVPIGPATKDVDSGDSIALIDFSKLTAAGTYFVEVPGVGSSYEFSVGPDVFSHSFRLAMRAYTGQRCGIDVNLGPDFPQFHYDACHTKDAKFDPSSGKEGTKQITGGWHDAGDFGRYIVNSGITTGTLLWAYELNADKLKSINLDIPESHGKIPDVLAEIKWNLDWMLKMQDEDGGVWHKSTTANFPAFIMPKDDNKMPMLIIGSGAAPFKTAEATADFAAVMAIAGRVYQPFDEAFAEKCLAAAEMAWDWVEQHPDAHFRNNPSGIQTGGYGGNDSRDELLWASAELFRTTGKSRYNDFFLAHYTQWSPSLRSNAPQGWGDVQNLGMYSYVMSERSQANADAVAKIKSDALRAADEIVQRSTHNGYRTPLERNQYVWGSNSLVGNYAMMLLLANRLSPKPEYLNAAQDCLHYLLGRNTFNTSYVTWLGSKWPMHPHHRPSGADGVEQPWPGMLVGGPNAQQARRGGRRGGATTAPAPPPPARSWWDDQENYTVNEIAINWNAPLVFMLAEVYPSPK